MAILLSPGIHSFPFSIGHLPGKHRLFYSVAATVTGNRSKEMKKKKKKSVALVWFKHDLRIDDHPALVAAASQYEMVVPFYVFDQRILSRFSDQMLELLLFALEVLRKSLKNQGAHLVIRFGDAEDVIQELIKEVKATTLFAEEEVEYNLRGIMDIVKESLSMAPFSSGNPELVFWQTPFYDIKNLKEFPSSHRDFRQFQFPITTPLPSPVLPGVIADLDWGTLPTFDDVRRYMEGIPCKLKTNWTSIKEISAETILKKEIASQDEVANDSSEGLGSSRSYQSNQSGLYSASSQTKGLENSPFISKEGNLVGSGTNDVLNALSAYLRYLEGTTRGDWQEMHEKLRKAECRSGASFGALFGSALCLGIISRRRVYYEAIKYERELNAGFLSPFGYSTGTIAAAVDAVCSMEWYWLMALKSQISSDGRYSIRIWRWKGYLIQYTVAGLEGPAILLVHGFGAFLEHYRDNLYGVADDGNRVWAITLLGFGKSEKPNIVYTELMWAELLRDFIIDVVGEPVHLAGNSIGGYFAAIVAGLWPALVKSLALINTAGSVIPGDSFIPFTEKRRTSKAAWLGSRLLLFYLRLRVRNIVKNFYPTNQERADDWLIHEMLRASYDPGVVVVLESIFSFNLSIPLNYLLKPLEGKVLIIQGMRDPLSNSKLRLSMLREHCTGIVFRELEAGHCPHDELPEEVNSIMREWIMTAESSLCAF